MPSTRHNNPHAARSQPTQGQNNSIAGLAARRKVQLLNHQRSFHLLESRLSSPFSELAEYADFAPVDINTFVHRCTGTRQAEVDERPRRDIRRPLKPFMLYRMCYQERIKAFCEGIAGNQMTFSSICGASWKRETGAVKQQFRQWVDEDSRRHREAFPDWKFTCRPPRKRVEEEMKEEEEAVPVMAAASAIAAPASCDFGHGPAPVADMSLMELGCSPLDMPDMDLDMGLDMSLDTPLNMPLDMPLDIPLELPLAMPLAAAWRPDQTLLPPLTNEPLQWWPQMPEREEQTMPQFQPQTVPQADFQQQSTLEFPQEMTINPAVLLAPTTTQLPELYPQANLPLQEQVPSSLYLQANLDQQTQSQDLYLQDDLFQQQQPVLCSRCTCVVSADATNQLKASVSRPTMPLPVANNTQGSSSAVSATGTVARNSTPRPAASKDNTARQLAEIKSVSDEQFRHMLSNVLSGSDWGSELGV